MFRNRQRAASAAVAALALLSIPACVTAERTTDAVTTASAREFSPVLLFPPNGLRLASAVRQAGDRPIPAAGESASWEMTKTYNAGRTRVSAVRHNGNVTEYYTSSSGSNGSTRRRRVTSRSTNIPYGHHHRP